MPMFTIKDNGDGSADLFHDGTQIGTIEHDHSTYQVTGGVAHGHSRYVARGLSVTDSRGFMDGNHATVSIAASSRDTETRGDIKPLLRGIRDRYVAEQLALTKACLADGRMTPEEVESYAEGLAERYAAGVTDFRPLEDGLRGILREHRREGLLK